MVAPAALAFDEGAAACREPLDTCLAPLRRGGPPFDECEPARPPPLRDDDDDDDERDMRARAEPAVGDGEPGEGESTGDTGPRDCLAAAAWMDSFIHCAMTSTCAVPSGRVSPKWRNEWGMFCATLSFTGTRFS